MIDKPSLFTSKSWYLPALVVLLFYGWTVFNLADNTPKFDDLNDVFGFFKELAVAQTFWQKVGAFFYPNNEHITVTNHVIYWLQYQLTGSIYFRWLIIIGHTIIALTACVLAASIQGKHKPFYSLVMILAYVNLYCWDSSFKAMTALSNQSVILFSVASLLLLQRYQKTGAAIAFAFLASFSQANGMLVWIVGAFIIVFDTAWQGVRIRPLALWLLGMLLSIALYIWAKKTYSIENPAAASVDIWALWQQKPWLPFTSTLAFLGGTGLEKTATLLAIIIGMFNCTVIITGQWLQPRAQQPLFYIALFIIASAIAASGLRGLIGGSTDTVVESRYKMYSLALFIIALLFLAENIHSIVAKRCIMTATLALAILLHVNAYQNKPLIQLQAEKFNSSYQHWVVDGDFKHQAIYFPPMSDYFLFIAHHLQLLDFFQFTPSHELLTTTLAVNETHACPTASTLAMCAFKIQHRGNAIAVQLFTQFDAHSTNNRLWLCNNSAKPLIQFALPDAQAGAAHWLIPEALIPAGEYQVWITGDGVGTCAANVADTDPNHPSPVFIKKPRKVDAQMRQIFNGSVTPANP